MEQVAVQGANQVFITSPAGYASKDVSGAANVVLGTSEGDADLIELTGALTGNIIVTIPTPNIPMVDGTAPNAPLTTRPGWKKAIINSTTGAFTLTVRGPGGTGVVIPQGSAVDCLSKDGVNVRAIAGGSGGGGGSVGLQLVFQPTAVPTPDSGNTYHTWATFMAAFTALALVSGGQIQCGVDSTLAPAFSDVGINDFQGLAIFNGIRGAGGAGALLTIRDGSQLLNLQGWRDMQFTCVRTASALLPIKFSLGTDPVFIEDFALLRNNGTLPAVDIEATTFFYMTNNSTLVGGGTGAEIFNIPAGKVIALRALGGSSFQQAQWIMSGAGGFQFIRDTTSGTFITDPAQFTGAVIAPPLGGIVFQGQRQPNGPAPIGAVTYVVDATFFSGVSVSPDDLILCRPTGAGTTIIDLPDATLPMNKQRIIQIVDDNGTSGTNSISLVPSGAQNLNGANALQALSSKWGTWLATCDGTGWVVSPLAVVGFTQEFLASNAGLVVPVGITSALLEGCGGGGGGGGGMTGTATATDGAGGGGGARWQSKTLLGLVPGAGAPVVIGAGGAGGGPGPSGANGAIGLATTFGGALAVFGGASGGQGAGQGGAGPDATKPGRGGAGQTDGALTGNVFDLTESVVAGQIALYPFIQGSGGMGGDSAGPTIQSGAANGGAFVGGAPGASFAGQGQGGGGGGAGPFAAGGAGGAGGNIGVGTAGASPAANTGAGGGGGGSGGALANAGAAGGTGGSGRLRVTWLP